MTQDWLTTADGERLAARVSGSGADWVVLAHGFSGSSEEPHVRRIAALLEDRFTVLSYDSRGHGRSSGLSTLGDREVLDVDAAIALARAEGARRVAVLGFSMGAASVLRHAGRPAGYALTERPDAVVAVSSTGPWTTWRTASRAMRRVHALTRSRPGRLVAHRLLRTRVDPRGWPARPVSPVEAIPAIAAAGIPLLVVHGDRDRYFGPEHPAALGAAGAEVWLEGGFGHAEIAMSDDLARRIGDHVEQLWTRV